MCGGGIVYHVVEFCLFLCFCHCCNGEGGLVHHFVEFWLLCRVVICCRGGGIVHHSVEFGLFLCLCPLQTKRGGWYRASFCGMLVVVLFWTTFCWRGV